jgi:hypothetical protein
MGWLVRLATHGGVPSGVWVGGCPGAAFDRASCNRLQVAVQRLSFDILYLQNRSQTHPGSRQTRKTFENKDLLLLMSIFR